MRFTTYTPVGAAQGRDGHIGKIYRYVDGVLSSGDSLFPNVTLAQVVTCETIVDLHQFLVRNQYSSYCLTWSVPKGLEPGPYACVPKNLVHSSSLKRVMHEFGLSGYPTLARSTSDLKYEEGDNFITVDYDPSSFHEIPLTPAQVWECLCRAEPLLANAPHIELHSSSSHIWYGDRELRGARGCRIIFPARLHNSNGPRIVMENITNKLILQGDFWPMVDKAGRLHIKTVIDRALYRVMQPDFLGSVRLQDGLTQKRPEIVLIPGTQGLDYVVPFDQIRPLSLEDQTRLAIIKRDLNLRMQADMHEARNAWHIAQDEQALLRDPTADVAKLRAHRELLLNDELGALPPSHTIYVDGLGAFSVAQILANPTDFSNKSTASPIEPLYRSENGLPTPNKGKISKQSGYWGVVDYAHGSYKFYRFTGQDTEFEMYLEALELETPTTNTATTELIEANNTGKSTKAVQVVGDAPLPEFHSIAPAVLEDRYHREARRSLRRNGGVTSVAGIPLQRAFVDTWLNDDSRTAIGVASYADAWSLRQKISKTHPNKKIMIMPGRSTNPVSQREKIHPDLFTYYDPNTQTVVGQDDALCHKLDLIRELQDTGLSTISTKTCLDPKRKSVCPHLDHCGYNTRLRVRESHDVLIYMHASLIGTDNPMIAGGELQDLISGSILFDVDHRPTSNHRKWKLSTWEKVPGLAAILKLAEQHDGFRPLRVPKAHLKDILRWARSNLDLISPSMELEQARLLVKEYQQLAKTKVDVNELSPQYVVAAIDAWLKKLAFIRVAGGYVNVFMHEPLRRLDGSRTLIAHCVQPKLALNNSRLSTIQVGDKALKTPVIGTVELAPHIRDNLCGAVVRSTGIALPKKVLQITGNSLAIWFNKHHKNVAAAPKKDASLKQARDLVHLAYMLLEKVGPGIVMSAHPAATADAFALYGIKDNVTHMSFGQSTSAYWLSDMPPGHARWLLVVGRVYPSDNSVLRKLADTNPSLWASGVPALDDSVKTKIKPRYGMRDGTFIDAPQGKRADDSNQYRDGGLGLLADEIIMSDIAAPVAGACSWLAERESVDGKSRMLAIFSSFPLTREGDPENGILLDDLSNWEAVPSASLVLRSLTDMNATEIGERLDVLPRRVRAETEGKSLAPFMDYWTTPLEDFDLDEFLDDAND